MKIIFYKASHGNIVDKLIAWWTSSLSNKINGKWRNTYSHVEILFSDNIMYSASQYENKTRFKNHNIHSDSWKRINIIMSSVDEEKVRDFCIKECLKPYDYAGVLGFVFLIKQDKNKWFCSEVCTKALQVTGLIEGLISYKTSPNKLYERVTDEKL